TFDDLLGASFYFHCAGMGHKLRCIQNNPRVSLVVLKAPGVLGEQFSMAYESVIVQGNVDIVNNSEEKRKALTLLIQRITPQHIERGEQYINRAIDITTVLRLRISEFSGKSHSSH
ncbi:MAG: pyridoxamine 5'-phosphate oxidase family protein, partial [Akkermansia sp.]